MDPQAGEKPRKRFPRVRWGADRPLALVVAIAPFGLFADLAEGGKGTNTEMIGLLVLMIVLVLLAFGLERAKVKADPANAQADIELEVGRVEMETEFEGPDDDPDPR
jgi:hypothetical protein